MSADDEALARLHFEAEVIHWRGPSPFFFVPLPPEAAAEVRRVITAASYGWGMAPVAVRLGEAAFTTALFPKDGTYFLPLKDAVRRKVDVTAGDRVTVEMAVQPRRR